jgi:hypothetical protein
MPEERDTPDVTEIEEQAARVEAMRSTLMAAGDQWAQALPRGHLLEDRQVQLTEEDYLGEVRALKTLLLGHYRGSPVEREIKHLFHTHQITSACKMVIEILSVQLGRETVIGGMTTCADLRLGYGQNQILRKLGISRESSTP